MLFVFCLCHLSIALIFLIIFFNLHVHYHCYHKVTNHCSKKGARPTFDNFCDKPNPLCLFCCESAAKQKYLKESKWKTNQSNSKGYLNAKLWYLLKLYSTCMIDLHRAWYLCSKWVTHHLWKSIGRAAFRNLVQNIFHVKLFLSWCFMCERNGNLWQRSPDQAW